MPHGSRRQDPLAAVWNSEVMLLLKSTPSLRAVAVFDEIPAADFVDGALKRRCR
jgi:hypothetical protein